jgi:hypothetical protein
VKGSGAGWLSVCQVLFCKRVALTIASCEEGGLGIPELIFGADVYQ